MELYVEPGMVKRWVQFRQENPPFSIALDGYVMGIPRFNFEGPHANFNHHEGVDRVATRSTCGQVYVAIKRGILNAYHIDGKVQVNIFVNDPDQDTSLAVWLLQNHERIEGIKSEPLISRLVHMEDVLDMSAGSYPFNPELDSIRMLEWVFEPYSQAKKQGIHDMAANEMKDIIESVGERITRYADGQAQQKDLDTSYEVLRQGPGWIMIHEQGTMARSRLFWEGHSVYLSYSANGSGTATVSVGNLSPYTPSRLKSFYKVCNEAEGISGDELDKWGGGNDIGGSPRIRGTHLSLDDLARIMTMVLS